MDPTKASYQGRSAKRRILEILTTRASKVRKHHDTNITSFSHSVANGIDIQPGLGLRTGFTAINDVETTATPHRGRSASTRARTRRSKRLRRTTSAIEDPEETDETGEEEEEEESERQTIGGLTYSGIEGGNLCYSVTGLQALAATGYVEWLQSNPILVAEDEVEVSARVNAVFQRINQFYTTKSDQADRITLVPRPVQLQLDDIFDIPGRQQSAVEFITLLHDRIMRERPDDENPLLIEGIVHRTCLFCGLVVERDERFNALPLLKPTETKAPPGTVELALQEFQAVKNGPINFKCDRCVMLALRKIITRVLKTKRSVLKDQEKRDLKARRTLIDAALEGNLFGDDDVKKKVGVERRTLPPLDLSAADGDKDIEAKMKEAHNTMVDALEVKFDSSWAETRTLTRLPQILVLEFANVAQMGASGYARAKLRTRIQYNATADFNPFCSGTKRNEDALKELRDPEDDTNPQYPLYELRAVLVHRGPTMDAGHWVCYRREWQQCPNGEQWWHCNDEVTGRVFRDDVLGRKELEDPVNKSKMGNMYGLIYERLAEGAAIPGTKGEEISTVDLSAFR